jgi:hypothetical protein
MGFSSNLFPAWFDSNGKPYESNVPMKSGIYKGKNHCSFNSKY